MEALLQRNPEKRFCPICGILEKEFRGGGTGGIKRKNAKCPSCGSLERHRLSWLYITTELWPQLPTERKKDVLHVAPEQFFRDILHERPDMNYISGDLFMADSALRLDLTNICLWDQMIDVIICSHVLEHIPYDRTAMREMYRILRPGGFLLVMVPIYGESTYEDFSITSPTERVTHFGQEDHVRKYGRDISLRLGEAGFVVEEWPRSDNINAELKEFLALGPRILHVCRKEFG